PILVWTSACHSSLQPRTPELKRSASLSLPDAWTTGARHCSRRKQRRCALGFGLVLDYVSMPDYRMCLKMSHCSGYNKNIQQRFQIQCKRLYFSSVLVLSTT